MAGCTMRTKRLSLSTENATLYDNRRHSFRGEEIFRRNPTLGQENGSHPPKTRLSFSLGLNNDPTHYDNCRVGSPSPHNNQHNSRFGIVYNSPTLLRSAVSGSCEVLSAKCQPQPDYDNLLFEQNKSEDLCRLVLQKRLKKQGMVGKHLGIQCWLDALSLQEYLPLFQEFSGVEDLLGFNETRIRDIGVKNCAHRAKLVTSLGYLREKYQRSTGKRNSWCQSVNAPLSPLSPTNDNSVPVSFEKLQQDLQEELQGDPANLRSHKWYHGHITRTCSEQLVKTNGDFLIRDSISQPGDFVLTCGWHGVPMHFIVNSKVLMVGSSKPKVTYYLEEEEFASIQILIEHYLTNGKPVTKASNVILKQPIARQLPLCFYDMKYGSPMNKTTGFHSSTPNASPKPSPFVTPTATPPGSPIGRRRIPKRTGSIPLISLNDDQSNEPLSLPSSPLGRSDSVPMMHDTSGSPVSTPVNQMPPAPSRHVRSGSEPTLTPFNTNKTFNFLSVPDNKMNPASSESSLMKAPPPKPSRIPSMKKKQRPTIEIRNADLYSDDRDYSELDQVLSTPSWIKSDKKMDFNSNQNIKNGNSIYASPEGQNGKSTAKGKFLSKAKFSLLDNTKNENAIDEESLEQMYDVTYLRTRKISLPNLNNYQRSVNLASYSSIILSEENKPLDASAVMTIQRLLLDNDPRKIALHLTKLDLDFIRIIDNVDLGVGVTSGLELITLPQGTLLRQDIIERSHCLQLFVAGMILSCNKTTQRAQILSKWIQVATELKNTIGNLFSFVSIMEGLALQPIKRLSDTWLILRQNHTGSAMIFDKKLRATYQMLMEGSGTLPLQNVCIPNIFPVVCLLERNVETIMEMLVWETNSTDAGLESLFVHLDTARIISSQFGLYKMCGQSIISQLKEDPQLREIFKTEFQMRLLWGKKGSVTGANDRYKIFDRILIALSNQKEAPGDDGTAV